MPSRKNLAVELVRLVGDPRLKLIDPGTGWPASASLTLSDGYVLPLRLYVAPVTGSNRDRDDVERRFQNPGSSRPIEEEPGTMSVLVGLWDKDAAIEVPRPLLVVAEASRRVGRLTRYSVFAKLESMTSAEGSGWTQSFSSDGEQITYIFPQYLAAELEARRLNIGLDQESIALASSASGILEAADENTVARARRAVEVLVRDGRFKGRVCTQYDHKCAMCGLNFGLIEAAHIYPASAPGSTDEVWNGVALCRNHHAAFDAHLVWVDPQSSRIKLSGKMLVHAEVNDACRNFVATTAEWLSPPMNEDALPRPEMFTLRYAHFDGRYAWAT
jgi:HNH endonuclease